MVDDRNANLTGTLFPPSKDLETYYWLNYDPFAENDLVCGDLYDDLMDIARDLQSGIEEYETGRRGNAVWEWRIRLDSHLGQHSVDAMRVLHALRT
ncbi:MAG: DUF5063 domain-containing protein [Mailhella sp.]|nr:DUF5063 domain-containing protein [Mailhella sp.]